MKIAFIGLGAMGYPMARHVARDYDVTVWNRTQKTAEKHAEEHGTRLAASLEACAGNEVVLTILPTSLVVDEIVDRLLPKMGKGALWIDCTSGDPVAARKTAARLADADIGFVDAPVSGGIPGAQAGTLTVMVGGTSENYERAGEVLETFGSRIVHVGESGAGDAVKAANNAMMGANMWMAAECLVTLKKLGINLESALEVLNSGSGRSFASESLIPSRILKGEWPLMFKLALHDKDIRIASSMAQAANASTPMLSLTAQLYTTALADLGDQADYVEVMKYAAKMNAEEW